MLILTKYKDYYDYLQGIYGTDPKLVLDRRDGIFPSPYEFSNMYLDKISKITFIICGYKIEGYRFQNKIYYGESLLQFEHKEESDWNKKWYPKPYKNIIIKGKNDINIALEIIPGYDNICQKLNCPILISSGVYREEDDIEGYDKFPPLHLYNLASFIPAEQIYQWLNEWLGKKVDESTNLVTEMTNHQKIESKGFDKIISFRHRK